MESSFLPLLFGGDINVYSMARAFHEAYGIRSTAYGKFPTGPCYQSDIIDYRPCRDIESDAVFVEKVTAFAHEHRDKNELAAVSNKLGQIQGVYQVRRASG